MTESNIIQTIIQGGGVGTTVLLIWVTYKLVTNHDSHLLDALDRNTSAWKENALAMGRNVEALNKLADRIDAVK